MNKKISGFTLIELLAVVVILAIIIILITSTALGSIKRSTDKAYLAFAQNIERVAYGYVISNENNIEYVSEISDGDGGTIKTCYITIWDLKNEGLLKTIVNDPRTSSKVSDTAEIKVTITKTKTNVKKYDITFESSSELWDPLWIEYKNDTGNGVL